MELVVQFGYLVLFGQLFPLAAIFSIIANRIQINVQISNLGISRRHKPAVGEGIGNWMNALEVLSTISIFFNCLFIYFTSTTYQKMFVGKVHEDSITTNTGKEEEG